MNIIFQPKFVYIVENGSDISITSIIKSRRHSFNPGLLPGFLRRVSVSQMGRKMSLRSRKLSRRNTAKTSKEAVSSTSQPHLNQTMKRSSPAGLDRTRSVSGTFFRRTQRKSQITQHNSQINCVPRLGFSGWYKEIPRSASHSFIYEREIYRTRFL